MAAPKGNQYAAKGRPIREAFQRALEIHKPADQRMVLDALVKSLLAKALEGDIQAAKEIFDRLEGKSIQFVGGDSENPIEITTNRLSESTSELLGQMRKGAGKSSPEAFLPH
jgi:hypothetical protein